MDFEINQKLINWKFPVAICHYKRSTCTTIRNYRDAEVAFIQATPTMFKMINMDVNRHNLVFATT